MSRRVEREGWSEGTVADIPAPLNIRPRIPSQPPQSTDEAGNVQEAIESAHETRIPAPLTMRPRSSRQSTNEAENDISAEENATVMPGKSSWKPIRRLAKKLSTVFRRNRDADDDEVPPPRQSSEAPSAPPLATSSVPMKPKWFKRKSKQQATGDTNEQHKNTLPRRARNISPSGSFVRVRAGYYPQGPPNRPHNTTSSQPSHPFSFSPASPPPSYIPPPPPIPPPPLVHHLRFPSHYSPMSGFDRPEAAPQPPPTPSTSSPMSGFDVPEASSQAPQTPTRRGRPSPSARSPLSGFDRVEATTQAPPMPSRGRRTSPSVRSPLSGFDGVEATSQQPSTPSRRRQVSPSARSPVYGLDGADDLWMVDNSKVKLISTIQIMERKTGRDTSKRVSMTTTSSVGIASKDDLLLKRVERHGVYTITYGTEPDDASDMGDDEVGSESEVESESEVGSESEAGSLASYDNAENEALELPEDQSEEKYSGKLERPDLYQFRYFDELEQDDQDDQDGDVESEDRSNYDVSMMRFDVAASDRECRTKETVERNRMFINTHCNRIQRDLQQPEEASLGDSDCTATDGACCVLPGHVVQREGADARIEMLQASSCDQDGRRSTYLGMPMVHSFSQGSNLHAGLSEIGGGCMWAGFSEEGGNFQLRAGGILATVQGDSHTADTIAEQPLLESANCPASANVHFPASHRYVSGPGDFEKGRSHNKHAEPKTPTTSQLDGPSDLDPELSPTRSTMSPSEYNQSFSTRQSFREITRRLLLTSSTHLLPLVEPDDTTLEPRKYNPDSSSTENLSTSAMNPLRRRATTAGSYLHENQISPSPRRVRFEDSNDIENASLNRALRSRQQTDHLNSRDASLSSQASNQLSASSQVVPFTLDERITHSRSHSSRRLPSYVMSTTQDLPGGQSPYGDSLNTQPRYGQQHLFDRTREGPSQSPLYTPSPMELNSAHDISSSDDIFGGPSRDLPHRGLPPQSILTTQGLNILYDDPARIRVPHFLEPNEFTALHKNELASERYHTRRRRRLEAPEPFDNNATTFEADYNVGQASTLYRQPTARHQIMGELTSPSTIASHSGHRSGFDNQPSILNYELQDWSTVNPSTFRPERTFGSDRQHTAHDYSGDDSSSQYPSPLQSGPMPDFAYRPSARGYDIHSRSFGIPTASQPEEAVRSNRQPIFRYDRNEYLSQYLAPVHSGQMSDLTYQHTAPGHELQGFPSDNPTTSHAEQAYGLDRHPRTYGSITSDLPSMYPSIHHSDQTNELTYTPGGCDYRTQDEFPEGSIDSQGYSATSLFRRPRLHSQDVHSTVRTDFTGFQTHQDTPSSTLFDNRGRTAPNPSPEVTGTSPIGGISRFASASPSRARAAGPPQLNKAVPPLPLLGRSNTIGSSVSTTYGRTPASSQLASLGRSNTTGGSVSPVRHMHESPADIEDDDDGIYATSSAVVGDTNRPRRYREPTKDLFGPKGILSRPATTEQSMQRQYKGKTALKRFKEKVRTITSDVRRVMTTNTNTQPSTQPPVSEPRRHPPVSLSPTIQARLFGELELILTTTINTYLNNEMAEGRMSLESVEKTVKKWKASHQPLPTEFMFDLGTQLQLVRANCETFRFYGEHQGSSVRIHAMFKAWEGLAKRLNRRTLATPDAEIRKYVADISNILALLGASAETWTTFEFWRSAAVLAIEAVGAEERARAAIPWGVTTQVYSGPD